MATNSDFTLEGINIANNDTNMTYLYGLSDFFTVMFEDPSLVNTFLEAETQVASDIYNRFLQLTSTLSLNEIQTTLGTSIKLVTINNTDLVIGKGNTYQLSDDVLTTKTIANRPFLPTEVLENGVDYRIYRENGVSYLELAKPLGFYAFPTRKLPGGDVEQVAMWFVDTEIDEQMMQTFYGRLIGVSPEASTEQFSNFVYGLFFVYTQGPTLEMLRKGLNLVLGLPLARTAETVLDVRMYLQTDQYIVITDQNQYLIPYGLPPSIEVGQQLQVGQELAQWIEIKDYLKDGEWWLNLQIPPSLVPVLPEGQIDRYATAGSHLDFLMRTYLRKHTFLVNVNVKDFKNIQGFAQLWDIINRVKPSYTTPVYIWTVEVPTETMALEDPLNVALGIDFQETIGTDIERFYRYNRQDPNLRSKHQFMRCNIPDGVGRLIGEDPYTNGMGIDFQDGTVTGFVNAVSQFRENTRTESGWLRTFFHRGEESFRQYRGKVMYGIRGRKSEHLDGVPEYVTRSQWGVPAEMRVLPLYVTTHEDMVDKCDRVGLLPPLPSAWTFTLFAPGGPGESINEVVINGQSSIVEGNPLKVFKDVLFERGDVSYLGPTATPDMERTWAPDVDSIKDTDYILCCRIQGNTIGVYWVTTNQEIEAPSLYQMGTVDPLQVKYSAPIGRGHAIHGAPLYMLRGAGTVSYDAVDSSISEGAISGDGTISAPVLRQRYEDKYNPMIEYVAELHFEGGGLPMPVSRLAQYIVELKDRKSSWRAPEGFSLTPLYITTQRDIVDKCAVAGIAPPSLQDDYFVLFRFDRGGNEVNASQIDAYIREGTVDSLRQVAEWFMERDESSETQSKLQAFLPTEALRTYKPDGGLVSNGTSLEWSFSNTLLTSNNQDYILCVRLSVDLVAVYWVTELDMSSDPDLFDDFFPELNFEAGYNNLDSLLPGLVTPDGLPTTQILRNRSVITHAVESKVLVDYCDADNSIDATTIL